MRRLLAALCCAAAAAEPYGDPFDFFDKIYVVGVNESSGPARATAAALGLDVEVVDAVKPPERDGDFDAIRDQFTADALDDLSSGEIATSLSHRKALRAFLATTAETALIFEDDFAPSGVGLRARLRSVLHHLPPVWRVLYLGSCRANCGLEDRVGGDVFRTTSALCLHAFAVTRDGAERLLAGVRRCRPDLSSEVARRQSRCPADQAVMLLLAGPAAPAYAARPALFTQRRSSGDVFNTVLKSARPHDVAVACRTRCRARRKGYGSTLDNAGLERPLVLFECSGGDVYKSTIVPHHAAPTPLASRGSDAALRVFEALAASGAAPRPRDDGTAPLNYPEAPVLAAHGASLLAPGGARAAAAAALPDAARRAVDAAAESFRAAGAACPFEPEARSAALEAIARDLIYAGAAPLRPANVASAKVAAAAEPTVAEAAAAAAVAGQHLGTLRYRRKPRGPGARRRNRGGRRLLAFDESDDGGPGGAAAVPAAGPGAPGLAPVAERAQVARCGECRGWPRLAICAASARQERAFAARAFRSEDAGRRARLSVLDGTITLELARLPGVADELLASPAFVACVEKRGLTYELRPGGERNRGASAVLGAVVREPLARFVGGMRETLRRLFDAPDGAPTLADAARQATWPLTAYAASRHDADLGDLVRAYAADFACLRRFPGDERVRSQSSLLQAAARGGKAGFAHFKVFRYEALMANAAAPSNATGAKKRTERIEAVAGECLRAVAEDGDAGDAGGAPSEAALLAALEAAPDVLALLCATLAHDFVCLGYDFPPACAAFQARVDELPGDAPRFDGPARRGRTLLGRGDGKRVCLSQGVACGGPKDACYAEPKCRRKGDNPWARLKEASCDPQRPGYMCRGHSCWISVDCSVAKRAAATEAPEEDNCTCADYGL